MRPRCYGSWRRLPGERDKLLLGLLYATGLRVSEVVRLRWWDLDFERQTIFVWQGKGRSDRVVMLLGHKNLQTTTIYTRVAVLREQRVQSPIDTLTGRQSESSYVPQPEPSRPVGRMKIDLRPRKGEKAAAHGADDLERGMLGSSGGDRGSGGPSGMDYHGASAAGALGIGAGATAQVSNGRGSRRPPSTPSCRAT